MTVVYALMMRTIGSQGWNLEDDETMLMILHYFFVFACLLEMWALLRVRSLLRCEVIPCKDCSHVL